MSQQQEYLFQSKKSNNLLKLFKDEKNNIWIKECCIDNSKNEFIEELSKMIQIAFNETKNKGAIYFSQIVSNNEWQNFFKFDNKWKLIEQQQDNKFYIRCDIVNASKCFFDQLLGNKDNTYFYESKESENIIRLIKDKENIVWIDNYYIDKSKYEYIIEFCKMLTNAFNEIKEKGGEFHSQYVDKIEWETHLKNDDRWDLIEIKDDIVHIQCDINEAAECVIEAFLGRTLQT